MPVGTVVLYQDEDGTVPILDWMEELSPKARVKCLARIKRLRERGHELRRPEADYLRDEIYELRVDLQGVHYRILYFFHGRTVAVLAHGVIKEHRVPPHAIDTAIRRRQKFVQDPGRHTYTEELT
ncbi:MAG: type II toxin-antitoxin system RelE/ParE family toxin [Candidatus Latescibacteria bacterium]|nr:type II toxin-antitoxin system RelE/ParE family toxin [Candidatus Latescibacterota bacterium]